MREAIENNSAKGILSCLLRARVVSRVGEIDAARVRMKRNIQCAITSDAWRGGSVANQNVAPCKHIDIVYVNAYRT